MNDIIAEKLKLLPDEPGVYKMYDGSGEIIYVGKAVNLKNRVRQYFQHTPKPPKVEAMVSHIEDFQYIITSNETEALTLESNLIKALMPRYNILLKDDKHFPYVRLDTKQDLWFATKDTISKKYDHTFKDIFQEIFEKEYKEANPGEDFTPLEESVDTLKEIVKHQVGVIELSFLLDIDVVSEIFIRINLQGKPLNQEDFVMSKICLLYTSDAADD